MKHKSSNVIESKSQITYNYATIKITQSRIIGSGQAAIAAAKINRHYAGYDIDDAYVKLAERRIKNFLSTFNSPELFNVMEKGK